MNVKKTSLKNIYLKYIIKQIVVSAQVKETISFKFFALQINRAIDLSSCRIVASEETKKERFHCEAALVFCQPGECQWKPD
jgi:hypothetical protein